jgi:electron transfer flavoprotein alpha/beta subunit
MDIIVCIKQVPDTTEVKIDPVTNTLMREGVPSIVNPFDANAVELGLQLKAKHGGKVTVISMGPPQATEALRECLAMGCDEAILVSDRAFGGADTWATSYTLATAIKKVGKYDLILCGKQAIDGDTAQVGPGIAEHLNLPQVTYIRSAAIDGDKAVVERVIDDGHEVIEVSLPFLATVVKEKALEPRLPSMKGTMKAYKTEIPVWGAADINADGDRIGLNGSATQVRRVFSPQRKGKGEILTGDVEEVAKTLAAKLREATLI